MVLQGLASDNRLVAPVGCPLLLANEHSMRGIVRELKRKASAACRGKDLKANVRARMYWFRRRGCTINSAELGLGRLKRHPPLMSGGGAVLIPDVGP